MPQPEPEHAKFVRQYDLDRTTAFSDGVFAIAITLLVLSLDIPSLPDGKHEQLAEALSDLAPQLFSYALSFAVIARFWVLHHGLFGDLVRVDSRLTVLNLVYLALISFLPFPTEILGQYGDTAESVTLYALSVAAVAGLGIVMRLHALRAHLFDPQASDPTNLDRGKTAAFLFVPAAFLISIPVAFLVGPTAGQLTWLVILFGIGPPLRRMLRS